MAFGLMAIVHPSRFQGNNVTIALGRRDKGGATNAEEMDGPGSSSSRRTAKPVMMGRCLGCFMTRWHLCLDKTYCDDNKAKESANKKGKRERVMPSDTERKKAIFLGV
jgi:hypothetical protein